MSDTKYPRMRDRAAPFADTANWAYAGIAIAVLWYGSMILLQFGFMFWSNLPHTLDDPALVDAFLYGSTPTAVRWTLASFAIYTAILWGIIRVLHGRSFTTILGRPATTIYEFGRVSLYLLPLYAILLIPALSAPEPIQQFNLGTWLLMLPAMLPLLFVQISAEEFVFRGYLQSHLAALAKHPIVWMGVPSILFGLIHYDPTNPSSYSAWSYVVWAGFLGLLCADLTARTGTLGPALAVHFINNISAILVLANDEWLYGATLYIWPMNGAVWVPWIPFDALFLFTVWLTARLAVRR